MTSLTDTFALAGANLTSPVVLFFALGLAAAVLRSDLAFPEAAAKAVSLYLIMAIGFKGGAGVAEHGLDGQMAATLIVAVILSAITPLIAYPLLRSVAGLNVAESAATAGHYGSISIVTFVAATKATELVGLEPESYMAAAAAVMEAPAILTAVWLARSRGSRDGGTAGGGAKPADNSYIREVLTNGSVVLLFGAFAIGWITGPSGMTAVEPFFVAPFLGVLCLFLLDMGLVAGRGLREGLRSKALSLRLVGVGVGMPLISAMIAAGAAALLGLSAGGAALLITLAASASYIAAPAAMRLAIPEARPVIYLTVSLGVTFIFNLTVGIPVYIAMARMIAPAG